MTVQVVDGTNELAYNELLSSTTGTYSTAGELPLFSTQVSPAQLKSAYGINQITFPGPDGTTVAGNGNGQTIAIVEEGVVPGLESELTTFDNYFGIPAPPSFEVEYQNNSQTQDPEIVAEAALDVEWTHAIAPGAKIIVYDAEYVPNTTTANNTTASFENLLAGMQAASTLRGVSVVTLSYGAARILPR